MKITPIEIRQHTFEKVMRGYRPEEVDAFLSSLSQEWERVTGDQKMIKMQLELAEKELNKLREVEMTLFRTLKTAEDTSSQIIDQAHQAGEQYVAEARQRADELLAEARKKSAIMVQDAENQANYVKENIINDLKAIEHDFKGLERYKESMVSQIRALAANANESIDRFEKRFEKQSVRSKIEDVTNQLGEELAPKASALPSTQAEASPVETPAVPAETTPEVPVLPPNAEVPDDTPTILETVQMEETSEPDAYRDADQPSDSIDPDELPPLTDEEDSLPTVANISASLLTGVSHAASYQDDTNQPEIAGQADETTQTVQTAAPEVKKEKGSFFDLF